MNEHKAKYQGIAHIIKELIENGTFKAGEQLPSLRNLASEYGVSLNTSIRAYAELESEGLITSRARSGYIVTGFQPNPITATTSPDKHACPLEVTELIEKVFFDMNDKSIMRFSDGTPDSKLLPLAKMNKNIIQATRSIEGNGMRYEPLQGNVRLRRNVSKFAYAWGSRLTEDDLITTTGVTNAVALALSVLTRPGDAVAVESPCYFVFLQLANSLGLKVIELPTHPVTGIDIAALKDVATEIRACILVSNFSNPLGCCMTDEKKQAIVELLADNNVPLIEDDLYGDIYFGTQRPRPCKAWDTGGNVLWCSSVSKSLAPGYRVGWIAPGKFKDKLLGRKHIMEWSMPSPTQEAVALFMEKDRYELHLRKLRKELHSNSLRFQDTILHYFPQGTKVSSPQGGFMLWVELPEYVDSIRLFNIAMDEKISIAPGRLFTLQEQYLNCIRLSFGHIWSSEVEKNLIRLGELAKQLSR